MYVHVIGTYTYPQHVTLNYSINALTRVTLAANILLNAPTTTNSLKHKLKSKSKSQDPGPGSGSNLLIFQEEGCGHWSMSETDFSISHYRKHPGKNSWRGLVTLVKKHSQKKYQVNSCNNVHEQASQSMLWNHKNSHNSRTKTLNKNLQFCMWHLPAFYMLMSSKSLPHCQKLQSALCVIQRSTIVDMSGQLSVKF